jgi:hypothetical protein
MKREGEGGRLLEIRGAPEEAQSHLLARTAPPWGGVSAAAAGMPFLNGEAGGSSRGTGGGGGAWPQLRCAQLQVEI